MSITDFPATADSLLKQFASPEAVYRPMPLWVWNGDMTEARITEMLEQFAQQGMGGVFVHPRPGLITEYLSDRWFELWAFALSECKRLGLLCQVYDESSYPAGFAGGHVPARIPYATGQSLAATIHREAPVQPQDHVLGTYQLRDGRATALPEGADLNAAVREAPVMVLELRRGKGNPWTAWFPFVDQTVRQVAQEFIRVTYEEYRKRFKSSFGKHVRWFFNDEPMLFTSGTYTQTTSLPMSYLILREFRKEHGYSLQDRLADLFVTRETSPATRFDYYHTLQRLWTQNYLRPLYEWCDKHNVEFTGHFMEHEWPYPYLQPNSMDGYRWMHTPGIDLLAPQFDFRAPQRSDLFLLTVREADSVANQMGRARRMCETHGVGGHEATFAQFKQLSDWLMVNGINFIVPHLSYQTIAGARKYDYPQTFSDHSPWWESYRPYADHVSRLSAVLSMGTPVRRVLVLHPTTTGWTHASPMNVTHSPMPDENDFGGTYGAVPENDPMARLRKDQAQLVQWLCDHQVDFDLGDELILRDLARVEAKQMRVGQAKYDVVLVPRQMENWCESTLKLVEQYLSAGGTLLRLGEGPQRVNGRLDPRPRDLLNSSRNIRCATLTEMQAKLDEIVTPLVRLSSGGHLPALIGHQHRRLADGASVHLLVNSGASAASMDVRLNEPSVALLDTQTGELTSIESRPIDGALELHVDLPPGGHALLLCSAHAIKPKPLPVISRKPIETIRIDRFDSIARSSPNVLGLDFCDLTIDGTTQRGLYVTRANRLCWQAHGFAADLWDRQVQFRNNYDDFTFGDDSGFSVQYEFYVASNTAASLKSAVDLAVERPHLYEARVNGRAIPFASSAATRWLDEVIRRAPIGDALQDGKNVVTLTARPFDIHCEIDRVYLLGDFSTTPAERGFEIGPPGDLTLGDWTRQGLAQYVGSVSYRSHFSISRDAVSLLVRVPHWRGSLIRIGLDGRDVGVIMYPPYESSIDLMLAAGNHELVIEVVGSLKNLLGPHFCRDGKYRRWTGPGAWDHFPLQPPPGNAYEIITCGLLAPIDVMVNAE